MIKNIINGKIYIGQTLRPIQERLKEHRSGKSDGCRAIYNAIRKYGWGNFEKDYYECPDKDLNFDEETLVREMGTLSPGGYNLMGGGGSRGKPCEETKQKQSEAKLGKNNHNYKKPRSEETRQKIGYGIRGKKRSKETIQKITGENNHRSKRVYQYDIYGIFTNSFGSCGEAGRYLGNDGTNITKCARGKKNTAYGFKWSYTMDIFM